jgi:hypothetical protein
VLKEFGVLITCVTTNRWPQLAQTQLIYVDLKKNLSTNQMPQPKMSKQMPLKLRRPVYEPQAPRYNCATRVEFYLFSFVRLPNAAQQRYVLKKNTSSSSAHFGLSPRATTRNTESGMGHAPNDENCSCYSSSKA